MKVCGKCGIEISTRDGENICDSCDSMEDKDVIRRLRAKRNRQARHEAMISLGLKRVKGSMGGVYYE